MRLGGFILQACLVLLWYGRDEAFLGPVSVVDGFRFLLSPWPTSVFKFAWLYVHGHPLACTATCGRERCARVARTGGFRGPGIFDMVSATLASVPPLASVMM